MNLSVLTLVPPIELNQSNVSINKMDVPTIPRIGVYFKESIYPPKNQLSQEYMNRISAIIDAISYDTLNDKWDIIDQLYNKIGVLNQLTHR
jgi:hypothetical protein